MIQQVDLVDGVQERRNGGPVTALDSLTPRQCAVLDLLLAGFETNKQIAQEIGISPSTVKQRLDGAANKLRTVGRSATKREYERLRKECAFLACPSQHIPNMPFPPSQPIWDWEASPTFQLSDATPFDRVAPWAERVERSTGLEAFVEKLNGKSAITVIVFQAVGLVAVAVLVLTMMGTFYNFDFMRFVTR